MVKYKSAFEEWLHNPKPAWKKNLEVCNDYLFYEIKMSRKEVEKLIEKLDEYKIFEGCGK